MEWLVIDENYLNYLRKIEPHIPYSDYGSNGFKMESLASEYIYLYK